MNKALLTLLIVLNVNITFSQTANHWETVVFANDTWSYFIGNSQPNSGWSNLIYDESAWLSGIGGFGYGDGDDGTDIGVNTSVFLRKKFTVSDLSKITKIALHADFDDGFIAYINGVEIARFGISGTLPSYDTFSDVLHEATLHQGLYPELFTLNLQELNSILVEGENILAIQVHNDNETSSDLSSNFYLSFGIIDQGNYYSPTPAWFIDPVTLISNLPIIKLTTNGQLIPSEAPRIVAKMSVINYSGRLNSEDDIPNEYNSRITIKTRGSSSQSFPKKSYSIETQDPFGENLNVSLLGMPKENDWILYAPYSDKSLLRNALAFKMGSDMGRYASRTQFCEVFLDRQYIGVYVLMEKIKPDQNRVDISKLYPIETTGDNLTGGYILKFDRVDGTDAWRSTENPWNNPVNIIYEYPDYDKIVVEQMVYIQDFIDEFEENLKGSDYDDPILGYSNYINPSSFIDFLFVNEVSKNVDGYRLSSFFYKDKESNGGKINMGPIWDFNLGFGNANYFDENGGIGGYSYQLNSFAAPFWWNRLHQDPLFVNSLQCRWQELRKTKLHTDTLMNYLDSMHNYLNEAQERNFNKWEILDRYIWPNEYIGGTYANEIDFLKDWLFRRLDWLDNNFPGECIVNDITALEIKENKLSIYPNPFSKNLTISFNTNEAGEYSIKIINLTGQVLYLNKQKALKNTTITVNLTENEFLTSGFYICTVSKELQVIATKKIIKE